jgi:outer membrane phospholipase A
MLLKLKKKLLSALWIAILFCCSTVYAGCPEEKYDYVTRPSHTTANYADVIREIKRNFEPSYITLSGGYDRTGNIRPGDLLYEGQVYVHYNWFDNCKNEAACDNEHYYRVYIPIRFQVRQYTEDSSPVKTPSYNPGLRVYYWNKSWMNANDDFHYTSFGIHHYSNGQKGPTLNTDGTINTVDGSFSLEYLEASYYRQKGAWWGKANLRRYLPYGSWSWEPAQTDIYETWLVELAGKKNYLPLWCSTLEMTVGYKIGRKLVSPGNNASFRDNLQFTTEWSIPMPGWKDVRWYVRWDKGYDYYNINFENKINRFQAGFVASNF